jgi:hypothetical protein
MPPIDDLKQFCQNLAITGDKIFLIFANLADYENFINNSQFDALVPRLLIAGYKILGVECPNYSINLQLSHFVVTEASIRRDRNWGTTRRDKALRTLLRA